MDKKAHTIDGLRAHLFETLEALRDTENPMDIERASVINETAQVIINSAKVEVDNARLTGAPATAFLGVKSEPAAPSLPTAALSPPASPGEQTVQQVPGGRVVTHRLRG